MNKFENFWVDIVIRSTNNVFQLLLPEHRVDVHAETDKLLAELARELPNLGVR